MTLHDQIEARTNAANTFAVQQGLAADLHLHAQTLALPRVMSLAVFFILLYLLIIFSLNLSTFYNSSQVVKTRKNKIKCHLQSLLALSATCEVTCIRHESCALPTETRGCGG